MRWMISVAILLAGGGPAWAQSERAYVSGSGGFAAGPDGTSGDLLVEGGVRIAPSLFVFGDFGQFHNLQPSSVQPAVDQTVTNLASFDGVNVVGSAQVPAWYSLGGVRYELPARRHFSPFVFGGVGFARTSPTAQFLFSSGASLSATPSNAGDDVTNQVISSGFFTTPAATTSLMYALGGGVEVPVAGRLAADIGYRYSRIASDTPINANSVTFGIGYRF